MPILEILHYPDSRLRTMAKTVAEVDDEIRKIADDMLETMYEAPGIGLAATQVNVHKRIIVIDVTEDRTDPLVLINPEIIETGGEERHLCGVNRDLSHYCTCYDYDGIIDCCGSHSWTKQRYWMSPFTLNGRLSSASNLQFSTRSAFSISCCI